VRGESIKGQLYTCEYFVKKDTDQDKDKNCCGEENDTKLNFFVMRPN
jgi:hypothetical protein